MIRTLTTAALAALVLTACAEDPDSTCDGEIGNATSRFGTPEDVRETSSDDITITTLYWWSQGRSQTFVGTSDGCDVRTSTFTPI